MTTARQIVEAEVRELVRRRQLDPVREPGVVADLVEASVSDYQDRATTSALPPLGDPTSVTRTVLDAVAGFGPLQRHLDDPTVDDYRVTS